MIAQLRSDPGKISQLSRNNMVRMLVESYSNINVDIAARYKALWMTNKLDGSEDHLVLERIMTVVGQKFMLFRKILMRSPSPKNLKDLFKLITPPKGVKREENVNGAPTDKGNELCDCNGAEISYSINIEDQFGPPNDDEKEQITKSTNADEPFVDATSTGTPSEREQNQRDLLIELAPFCNYPNLKKDAASADGLSKFIKTHNTMVFPNSSKHIILQETFYLTSLR